MAFVAEVPGSTTEEIAQGLRLLHAEGDVFEIRILGVVRGGTISGYFNDPEKAAKAIVKYDGRATGVYVTINPTTPALIARAHNRLRENAKETTSDKDVARRRWLLIDVDPERPTGISSTKAELRAAGKLAREIKQHLSARGWPLPILAASGNGAHLLYRVDLANDDEAAELVKKTLLALDALYSIDAAHVDLKVFNAGRISKVLGTLAAKGDSTEERPHRRSKIIEAPDEFEVVSRELLEAISQHAPESPPTPTSLYGRTNFDLDSFMDRSGLSIRRTKQQGDRTVHELEECPFNPEHNRGEAYVGEMASGALFAGCQHDSCSWWSWKDLRQKYDPDWQPWVPGDHPSGSIFKKQERKVDADEVSTDTFFTNWDEFWDIDHTLAEWVVDDVIAKNRGHAIYASHKVGKSLLTLYLVAGIATSDEKCVVIYLDYEMSPSDLYERLADMGYDRERDLSRLRYAMLPMLPPMDTQEGADALLKVVKAEQAKWPDHHVLVVIDTMSRAVEGPEDKSDTYRAFYTFTGKRLKKEGCSYVRLDHGGKNIERGQRGSSAKGDDVDVVWKLSQSQTGLVLKRDVARMSWVPEEVCFDMKTEPHLEFTRATSSWPAGTLETAAALEELGVSVELSQKKAHDALKAVGKQKHLRVVGAAQRYRKSQLSLKWASPKNPQNATGQRSGQRGQRSSATSSATVSETPDLQGATSRATVGNASTGNRATPPPLRSRGVSAQPQPPEDTDPDGGDTPWRIEL